MPQNPTRQVHLGRIGSSCFRDRNRDARKVYSRKADQKPYVSSGEPKSSRGAPWLPVTMMYPVVVARVRANPDEKAIKPK